MTSLQPTSQLSRAGRSNAERIDAAFFIEECRGRELGFKLRVIAIAAIALLLLTIIPWP